MSYSDKVLDHYENPRNVGSFTKDDEGVGTGMVGAPACGDVMKLQIKVNEQGIIEDARFKTYGCGSAIASSSLATEMLKGKTVDEALEIKNTAIVSELSLPPVKIHCSILAEDAIKAAVQDYKAKEENFASRNAMGTGSYKITGWQPEPILYRTTVSYPHDWPSSATLRLRTAFDDGLVLYLNGMEIYRNNVSGAAGSPVDGSTRSLTAVNPAPCLTNINIAVTNLSPGSNCLAAAVVQPTTTDADSYFVLEVDATALFTPALPPEPLPVLQATSPDTNSLRLAWTGGGYALESSTTLDLGPASFPFGPWMPVPQMSNPYLWNLTNSPARFFRLKK